MTTLIPKVDLKNGGSTPTGAVNRDINKKIAEIVSVKDFGAVGNGSTDDTTAIQNAVNYVGSVGGTVYFPTGTYLISSTINVSYSGIIFAGESAVATAFGSKIVGNGTTPATLFSITTSFSDHTHFNNIALESAPVGITVPNGVLTTDLSLNNVVFNHFTDKAIYIADTSDGASGGLIVGNISNVEYVDCKSGFVSAENCMVNNVHFDNQWWSNPKDNGYGIYLGASTYTGNVSIENSLFNGKPGSTALPFSFGKFNFISIQNVQTADFTQVNGVTDNIPIIELRSTIIPNSVLAISGLGTTNPRGPIINNLAFGLGVLYVNSCDWVAGFSNQIITNLNKISAVTISNCRLSAPVRTSNCATMKWTNNISAGVTQPLNTFPTVASTNTTMTSGDVGSSYMFTTGASTLLLDLPIVASVPVNSIVTVTIQDAGGGSVQVRRTSTDTVGGIGNFTYTLTGQYKSVTLVSDGETNWYVQI